MKIFLDDYRDPVICTTYMNTRMSNPSIYREDWVIVRNYDEFVKAIDGNEDLITHVSFDHDLADEHYHPSMDDETRYNLLEFKEKTGYDCALWLKDYYELKNHKLPIIYVHSMNPVGCIKIKRVFGLV